MVDLNYIQTCQSEPVNQNYGNKTSAPYSVGETCVS